MMVSFAAEQLGLAKKTIWSATGAATVALPILLGIFHTAGLHAQPSYLQSSAATQVSFEVASVKPFPGFPVNFTMQRDGGRIRWANNIMGMVMYSYRVQPYQVTGVAHMPSGWYAIEAETSPDATEDQIRLMVQSLLSDRFNFQCHRETRELSGFALVPAKGGAKIKPAAADDPPAPWPDWFPSTPAAKSKAMEGRIFASILGPGVTAVVGRRVSIAQLTETLEGQLRAPVIDQTALNGQYYFAFKSVSMDALPEADSDSPVLAPTLFEALREALGLQLKKQTVPVNMLVVDHVEKTPSGN